jgi:hypothetical protein
MDTERFFKGVMMVGVTAYLALMAFYIVGKAGFSSFQWAVNLLDSGGWPFTFGIPIAGVAATVIVFVFGLVKNPGTFTLKALGVEFTGPGIPATVWLVTFITFIATIKLLHP